MSPACLTWEQAEALRKAGDWAAAGRYFHDLWSRERRSSAGWRYAWCLRKAGYGEAALRVVSSVVRYAPQDAFASRELVWTVYGVRLKPAVAAEDEGRVFDAAHWMLDAGADAMALQLALFAAVGVARRKGHWQQVREFCMRVDPAQLSDEPGTYNQKRLPSPRERWHMANVKSLILLEEWTQALDAAGKAVQLYPRQVDFQRWQARAQAETGDVEGALAALQPLVKGPRPTWYLLADESDYLERLDRLEEAWAGGMAGLRLPAEDKARVAFLYRLSELALKRGDKAAAATLVGWSAALRRAENWPVRGGLKCLMEMLADQVPGGWEEPPRVWRERGRALCAAPVLEVGNSGGTTREGRVTGYSEGKTFAFIKVGETSLFVLVRDLPEKARRNGAPVRCQVVQSFDKKKQRPSERATEVVLMRGGDSNDGG